MAYKSPLALLIVIITIVAACSVLTKEDPEQNVRTFLTNFQQNLGKSDQAILRQFEVKQTPEAVMAVIRILQNKEQYMLCEAQISQANLSMGPNEIKVVIPALFKMNGVESNDTVSTQLVMWLQPKNKTYVISRLEGEEFYQAFTGLKNRNEWEIERKAVIDSRVWTYEKARDLETKFDSVIWFATYGKDKYFYVVEGAWTNYFANYETRGRRNENIKMGLADINGDLVIPMEYDLIGTIAFEQADLVEVMKDGKVGYFDINKKQVVVEPKFDMIIQYNTQDIFAIVKSDTTFGWLTKGFEYRSGFPTAQAEEWFNKYEFLPKNLKLMAGSHVFCEIPNADNAGYGILIPPAYLVKNGIFDEIEGGISTTEFPFNAGVEYKETKGTWLQKITDGISAVVTSMNERYLEGREEFYSSSKIAFVNDKHDTLTVDQISGTEISIRAVDSTLLEVKTPHDYWFMENGVCQESNLSMHTYFAIANGGIKKLESKRLFPQTEFVKLDSSYLTGQFHVYVREDEGEKITTFLSLMTLTSMRDEILAANGYSFPGTEKGERYDKSWYNPRFDNIEQFREMLTEIDRHNLTFLDNVINALQQKSVAPDA
jgi:hypothetical protein